MKNQNCMMRIFLQVLEQAKNNMVCIVCFTKKGKELAVKIQAELILKKTECSLTSFQDKIFSLGEWTKLNFKKGNVLLFVGACGIAVRAIAPFVKSKVNDPAVVVIDENANFSIPLLSGHLGGANDFAKNLSLITGCVPVITTATDVNKLFSIDSFAKKNNLVMEDMALIKKFSSELLEQKKCVFFIPQDFFSFTKITGAIPYEIEITANKDYEVLSKPSFSVLPIIQKETERKKNINLIPKILILGIGCRKGKTLEEIRNFVLDILSKYSFYKEAVKVVCSIDLKKEEKGIVDFCNELGVEFKTFSNKELMSVNGDFLPSEFVKKITGVENVCERSVFACGAKKLLVKKTKGNGMTLAIGIADIKLNFDSKEILW